MAPTGEVNDQLHLTCCMRRFLVPTPKILKYKCVCQARGGTVKEGADNDKIPDLLLHPLALPRAFRIELEVACGEPLFLAPPFELLNVVCAHSRLKLLSVVETRLWRRFFYIFLRFSIGLTPDRQNVKLVILKSTSMHKLTPVHQIRATNNFL